MNITIVWLKTDESVPSAESEFSKNEISRQVGGDAVWVCGADFQNLTADFKLGTDELVLVLAHPWVTLEERCLERLQLALRSGFDIAMACDSKNGGPMVGAAYATVHGMERFVDSWGVAYLPVLPDVRAPAGIEPACTALVQLCTVAAIGLIFTPLAEGVKSVLVQGAYAHDASGYFANERAELLPLAPPVVQRALDVGGGEGRFLALLKARTGAETHLVELVAGAAHVALDLERADHVWVGDFLDFSSAHHFDCVSFLDVLEHMEDPERYLRHALTLLAGDGVVLASIPNVGHWSVVADLLEGRWDYASVGIHCVTHLRFFTARTVASLFARAGFKIERFESVLSPCPESWRAVWGQASHVAVDAKSLDTYAFLVRAVAKPVAGR